MKQPNFVFIMTDQQRADHLGCYGNPVVRTPHIDGLARRGLRFERFYVATPVCMPNRASIVTGRMPSVHRSRSNGIPLSLDAVTFPQLLRENGYETALIGKCHLQNMEERPSLVEPEPVGDLRRTPGYEEATRIDLNAAAYQQERRASWNDPEHRIALPYYGFGHVELCNHHADETFGDWSRWAAQKQPMFEQLCGVANAEPDARFTAPQAWRTRLPEALYSSNYVAERSVEYIRRHVIQGDGKPFFLQCSFPDPHHPFTPPGRYWDMYSAGEVAVPPTCRAPGPEAPPHLRWIHDERREGRSALTSQRMFAVDEGEARQMIALTYGMITMVDDAVGRILQALRDAGLEQDTVVVFTSDHGDFMGDHGLMLKGPLHYQGLIRVPFIWSDPAGAWAGERADGLASSVDIARTVLARAGVAPVNGMQGHDLVGLQQLGDGAAWPESVLIEEDNQRAYLGFNEPVRARTLVTERHRITLYRGANWGEIYDLRDDPLEQHNLWDRAPALRSQLLEALARKLMDSCDRSPRPTHVA